MSERETMIEVMARAILQDFEDGADMSTHAVPERAASRHARAALTALEAAGVRLVPVEATSEMIQMAESLHTIDELTTDEYRRAYKAMIAFSPYAPEGTRHD